MFIKYYIKKRNREEYIPSRKMGKHPAISQVFWSGEAMMKYLRRCFFLSFCLLFLLLLSRPWLILIRPPLLFSSSSFFFFLFLPSASFHLGVYTHTADWWRHCRETGYLGKAVASSSVCCRGSAANGTSPSLFVAFEFARLWTASVAAAVEI